MRVLLALPLTLSLHLHACDEQLPGGLGATPPAPTARGPHGGALLTVGGRPVELVARNDGTLEAYGLTAGPQALGADWPVSAQVSVGAEATRIVPLRYRPEASRYEATVQGAKAGFFRVGFIAEGKTQLADGSLAQLLPPGPPVPAPSLVDTAPAAQVAASDAGAATPAATATPTPTPSPTPTATPSPTPTATPSPTPTATPSPTPTATPSPTPTASSMRATTSAHGSGSGFGSSRRHNTR